MAYIADCSASPRETKQALVPGLPRSLRWIRPWHSAHELRGEGESGRASDDGQTQLSPRSMLAGCEARCGIPKPLLARRRGCTPQRLSKGECAYGYGLDCCWSHERRTRQPRCHRRDREHDPAAAGKTCSGSHAGLPCSQAEALTAAGTSRRTHVKIRRSIHGNAQGRHITGCKRLIVGLFL